MRRRPIIPNRIHKKNNGNQVINVVSNKFSKNTVASPSVKEINILISQYNEGKFDLAILSAELLIKKYPKQPFLWKILGVILQQIGRPQDALIPMQEVALLDKDSEESHSNLGVVFNNLGRYSEAEASCREAIKLKPNFAEAHSNLGNALQGLGRYSEAEASCREAIKLKPNFAEAHTNLGNALHELGRYSEAEASYRQAITLKPNFAVAHSNLGNALHELGRYSEAEASYRQAITLNPNFADAHSNLGNALHELGRYSEAEASYRQAITLNPNFAKAHSNLGNALHELGRYGEAEASCREAIKLKPNFAEAHSNLGNAIYELGRYSEAEASYRQAITLNPNFAEAHSNLGKTLHELGRYSEAEASYRQAHNLNPDSIEYIISANLLLPDIYSSAKSIDEWRQRYQSGLEAINALNPKKISTKKISSYTFNLAYHNLSNLHLMKERSILTRSSITNINYISPHIPQWKKPTHRKIRIAFCSRFLVLHTIGKLYHELIKKIDRSIFELVIIHTPGSKLDTFSERIDRAADKVIFLSQKLSIQHEIISKERLDILFYTDIGMESDTYNLAHARLAPIQIVSWGHPESTGIDQLDYFLSSSLIEPEDSDQHYSERLIKLSRLPCYYEPLVEAVQLETRASLGLPTDGTLYGCLQSLFKIHPDFDPILSDILHKDSKAHLIFLDGKTSAWSSLLRQRWAIHYPVLNERAIFLPRLPMDKFMALISRLDILLDPIYFGSGNTFYESMVYGVPTVTWPGRFMRGRIVAGAYKQMGVTDAPITEQITDYANLAVELGNNHEKRLFLKEHLQHASRKSLFSDISIVREFENFFLAAIDAADKGEILKINWTSKS